MAYTKPTISGYNSSPPPDDGTTGSDNEITWSKHKTKIGDPLKTYADAINQEASDAWDDLASTATDDGNKGFHLVNYPPTAAEVAAAITPTEYEYPPGEDLRYGASADRSTDDTAAVDDAITLNNDVPSILSRKTRHDSSVWNLRTDVDSKMLLAKGSKYSLASLPRFYQKLIDFNESTGSALTIVGMGSSVGNGAGLTTPATDKPISKFVSKMDDKFNKLGIYTFTEQNSSVNGTTLSGGTSIIDSVISTYSPDLMFLVYGMNDGGTNQYNTNQTYPFVSTNLKTIIQKCHDANCDVIVCTSPHPDTVDQTWSFTQTLAMSYPIASWILAENFTFTNATSKITATTSGAFTDSGNGFGLSVGKSINVSGTASNDGTYTIATIDASGDFITVSEAIADEASVSCTVKRVAISDDEIIPTPANSTPSVDALGLGTGHEINISYRHYRVNEAMRRTAIEMGVPVIDVEQYWFEAVYRHGVANLFDGAEVVHPNDTGYRQSYEYAINEFVDALAESYAQGIQQNSFLPNLSVNTTDVTASATIKEKSSSTTVLDVLDDTDTSLVSIDSATGLTVSNTQPTNIGALIQTGGNTTSDKTVSSAFNVAIASPKDVATTNDTGGYIEIHANQAGIGRQTLIYGYSNNGGTLTVSSILSVGDAVITSVTASGANIRITVVSDNTNIRYILTEIS